MMTRRKRRRSLVKKRKLYFVTTIPNFYLPTAISHVLGYVEKCHDFLIFFALRCVKRLIGDPGSQAGVNC